MKKTQENLMLLNGIFIATLIIANIVSAKVVSFWGLVIPAAIVAYPLTFLMTDVIGEIWGKEEANKTVKLGLICQLVSLVLIGLSILLPVAPFADNQAEFQSIMGQSFRVVGASLIGYTIAQFNDVLIFHKLKEKTGGKHKWLRNNLSTMASQLLDTAIFITIAFIGTVPNIWVMIASQYLIKVIYAAIDTPFFYALTKAKK
ncbi:MAG: queuosine precursor transporter [Acutalibacteraceae bacterium]